MGKNLKGKELGKGITQRKDGKYSARFVSKNKKRIERHFDKLSDAKQWLEDAKVQDKTLDISHLANVSMDTWYNLYINEYKKYNVKETSIETYNRMYKNHIKPIIGSMIISEIKPIHCQQVLNNMKEGYKNTSIDNCRVILVNIFNSAIENQVIIKSPMLKSVKCSNQTKKKIRFLTVEEQRLFIESSKKHMHFYKFLFVLQTGIRAGELAGIKWSDINFKEKTLHISRNLIYKGKQGFVESTLKTESSDRIMPLTDIAIEILLKIKEERASKKIINIKYKDYVFLNKKGRPIKTHTYNNSLKALCKRIGIELFSMHSLRHTFATRLFEAGVKPKIIQELLGHSNLETTMEIYVHCTECDKRSEIDKFESYLKVI